MIPRVLRTGDRSLKVQAGQCDNWRKGWDSNPRYPCRHAGFQDRCLKPLGHPSKPLKLFSFTPYAKPKMSARHRFATQRLWRACLWQPTALRQRARWHPPAQGHESASEAGWWCRATEPIQGDAVGFEGSIVFCRARAWPA